MERSVPLVLCLIAICLSCRIMQTFQPKTTIGACFLKTTTGRLEIFMNRHTGSDKHPTRVEFPNDEENNFEISYMQRSKKTRIDSFFQTCHTGPALADAEPNARPKRGAPLSSDFMTSSCSVNRSTIVAERRYTVQH